VGHASSLKFLDHTHLETPHSVGLLSMSDQPDSEISTWKHTALTRERHACIWRDSNPQASGRRPTPQTARPQESSLNYACIHYLIIPFTQSLLIVEHYKIDIPPDDVTSV